MRAVITTNTARAISSTGKGERSSSPACRSSCLPATLLSGSLSISARRTRCRRDAHAHGLDDDVADVRGSFDCNDVLAAPECCTSSRGSNACAYIIVSGSVFTDAFTASVQWRCLVLHANLNRALLQICGEAMGLERNLSPSAGRLAAIAGRRAISRD